MAQKRSIDELILLANIGERVVEIVKESGLLRVKRRAARTVKRKPRALSRGTAVADRPEDRKAEEANASVPRRKASSPSTSVPPPRARRGDGTEVTTAATVTEE